MPKKKQSGNVAAVARALAAPLAESLGLEIWDVEFKKEGAAYILRFLLDKEGGVDVLDCERFSRAIDPLLDEADPIEQSYYLEVSSAGLERPLRRESDFERFKGSRVHVGFYSPMDGKKQLEGELVGLADGVVTLRDDDGKEISFKKELASLIRLAVQF